MKTIAFLFLGLFATTVVGLLGSFVLAFVGFIHYPARKLLNRQVALALVTAANALVMVAWTAFVMLWVERGTPPFEPATWAAVVVGFLLIAAPVGIAHRSSMAVAAEQGLTNDQQDLLQSLNYLTLIQIAAMVWMFFDRSALHWWKWLPLTG